MNAVGDKIFVIGGYRKVSDDEIMHSPSEVPYSICPFIKLFGPSMDCSNNTNVFTVLGI